VIWGSCMSDLFLSTANRNCPMRRFLRKKSSLGYFCWEMPRMNMGVSWERKCLLDIVSQKLISYDFCTSFALHKVKWAFGCSKWKLRKPTCVSRFLAYVTCPHDWRIRVAHGKLKTSLRIKTILLWVDVSIQKPGVQEKGCCCVTYIMVCDRKRHKLSMERESWGFDGVIRHLCYVWSALLSHHRADSLSPETLIVSLSKNCDRPSIMFRQTECYSGVLIPLFTISVLAPIMQL
jgi:hypothetical protein